MYEVRLTNGTVKKLKAVRWETDERRIYFLNEKGNIIRSWLIANVEDFTRED